MIRALTTTFLLLLGSLSYAADECTNLTLECRATYRSYSADSLDQWVTASSAFADENWDEPSLKNCASTLYFTKGDLSVRVHANKDLQSNEVTTTAKAVQIVDHQIGDQTYRSAAYSNATAKSSLVGESFTMSTLTLPEPYWYENRLVDEVIVSCQAK